MFGKMFDKTPPPPPPNPHSNVYLPNQVDNFQCIHLHFMVTGVILLGWERKQEKVKKLEREKKKARGYY